MFFGSKKRCIPYCIGVYCFFDAKKQRFERKFRYNTIPHFTKSGFLNIDSGLVEIGYQIKPSYKRWNDYDLWKLKLNKNMWNYNEPNWPAINFNSEYVEPFAFGVVGFQVKY